MFANWSFVKICPKTFMCFSITSKLNGDCKPFRGNRSSNEISCHCDPVSQYPGWNRVFWAITRQIRPTRSTCARYEVKIAATSPYLESKTPGAIAMNTVLLWGHMYVINWTKLDLNRPRSFQPAGPSNTPYPIRNVHRPYNIALRKRADMW